ncbi:GNAT family N-acetyltransferase [Pedobacter cryoconitis]|uniref:RimJ/RimL family protein N-acetyltransferase n=1 Tax=Pedobacter cryoconitis TaxID=188932 RepID=A0A7X0MHQ7_9SPHI|nr:GNAT family protein [Pedobacter cryoconitis]MBB6499384.1 RimJ/RimL family protein N-acetyltransferase [Pedobacter cryoconitis]
MTESLAEIIRFGFQELGLNRIEAETRPGNAGSEKLLHKSGFRFEGLLREWMQWNGQKYDIRMHALLQRESKYLTK